MSVSEGLSESRVDTLRERWDGAGGLADGWAIQGSYREVPAGRRTTENQMGWVGALDVPPTPVPPLPSPAALPVVEAPFNICDYGWHCAVAERVVSCESKWDADAVSWDGSSYGLFQINAVHFWRWPNAWNEWDNPEVNTRWAWELWQEQGWGIWSCA